MQINIKTIFRKEAGGHFIRIGPFIRINMVALHRSGLPTLQGTHNCWHCHSLHKSRCSDMGLPDKDHPDHILVNLE